MKLWFPVVFGLLAVGCGPERGANVDFKASPLKPGGDITFSKAYTGEPALIYIWATWCGPCRQVAPKLNELKRKYDGKGISFIAVAQDEPDAVRKFEQAMPHDMDVVIDSTFTLSKSLDTSAIPVIAVVDDQHNTVIAQAGVPTDAYASIIAALDAVAKK